MQAGGGRSRPHAGHGLRAPDPQGGERGEGHPIRFDSIRRMDGAARVWSERKRGSGESLVHALLLGWI